MLLSNATHARSPPCCCCPWQRSNVDTGCGGGALLVYHRTLPYPYSPFLILTPLPYVVQSNCLPYVSCPCLSSTICLYLSSMVNMSLTLPPAQPSRPLTTPGTTIHGRWLDMGRSAGEVEPAVTQRQLELDTRQVAPRKSRDRGFGDLVVLSLDSIPVA